MKRLLVLGAGTAGTMAVNKLRPQLPRDEWRITVVDSDETHYYQPGYLFVPFGIYRPDEIVKPKRRFIPSGVDLVLGEIDRVEPDANRVRLVDGTDLPYDYLIIATGTTPRPEETPGRSRTSRPGPPGPLRTGGAARPAHRLPAAAGGPAGCRRCQSPT